MNQIQEPSAVGAYLVGWALEVLYEMQLERIQHGLSIAVFLTTSRPLQGANIPTHQSKL